MPRQRPRGPRRRPLAPRDGPRGAPTRARFACAGPPHGRTAPQHAAAPDPKGPGAAPPRIDEPQAALMAFALGAVPSIWISTLRGATLSGAGMVISSIPFWYRAVTFAGSMPSGSSIVRSKAP